MSADSCAARKSQALLKAFCERVLTSGFAFRYRGRYQTPERLLHGRSARCISTMDSPSYWYRFVLGRPLHTAFVRSTAAFVGFTPAKTTLSHEVRFMDATLREAALQRVAADAQRDLTRFSGRSFWSLRRPSALPAPLRE